MQNRYDDIAGGLSEKGVQRGFKHRNYTHKLVSSLKLTCLNFNVHIRHTTEENFIPRKM